MITKKYTFTDVFNQGVLTDDLTTPSVAISSVFIPSIQRAYAQGRTSHNETKIRKDFLDSIFECLVNSDGKPKDLHFIYGAVIEDGNGTYQLGLLDGQQRFTTLYLLHWYLLNREHSCLDSFRIKIIGDAMKSFYYKTRFSSTKFCESLAGYRCDLSCTTPSATIKNARWYFNHYDNDSTIQGMLVMLDAIHEKYNKCINKTGLKLVYRTERLQFHVLPLMDYKMSEELYLKMNARGLPITAFDNFKSEFTGVMKSTASLSSLVSLPSGSPVSHQERISILLDSKWIDLFWQPGRTDYDVHYMRFFSRFFAYRYMLDSGLSPREMQNTDLPINVFYTQSEDVEKRGEYLGFEEYKTALKGHDDYFEKIEKVLDALHDSGNMAAILDTLTPIWDKDMGKVNGNFFTDADVPFSQSLLVVFGAICEYIIQFPTFEHDIFRQWMRIVWNVVENTNIDSLRAATGPLRNLHTLLEPVAKASPTKIHEFYTQVSLVSISLPRVFKEEIEKARRIATNNQWLAEFIDAERHPYLKGSVGFFYDSSLNISGFIHNRDLVKTLFDKDGIMPDYRESHLLIRAIVSNLKTWDKGLCDRYITEKAETDKHLKLLLLDNNNDDIRKMFVDVLGRSYNATDIKRELNAAIITNRMPYYSAPAQYWDNRLVITHNALCDDIKLYDWMATQSSPVCVSEYKGHYAVAIPRVWYDRFMIDSERDQIAYSLMSRLWMRYVAIKDHTSLQDYYTQGRFKAENILLYRGVNNGISFHVDFLKDHTARVYLNCPDEQRCQDVKSNIDSHLKKNPNKKSAVPDFNTLLKTKDDEQIYRVYLDVDANGIYRDIFKYLFYKDFPISEIMKIYRIVAAVV